MSGFADECIELFEERVDLAELVHGASRYFIEEARRKGIDIELRIGGGVPDAVLADPLRLQQMLLILLGNAMKATASGGIAVSIEIMARETGHVALKMYVSDNGRGAELSAAHAMISRFVTAMHGTSGFVVDENIGSQFWFSAWFELQTRGEDPSLPYYSRRA